MDSRPKIQQLVPIYPSHVPKTRLLQQFKTLPEYPVKSWNLPSFFIKSGRAMVRSFRVTVVLMRGDTHLGGSEK